MKGIKLAAIGIALLVFGIVIGFVTTSSMTPPCPGRESIHISVDHHTGRSMELSTLRYLCVQNFREEWLGIYLHASNIECYPDSGVFYSGMEAGQPISDFGGSCICFYTKTG